jgi:hypothetical protein
MSLDPASIHGEGPATCILLYTGDGHPFYLAIEAVEGRFDADTRTQSDTIHFKPINISGPVAEELTRRLAGEPIIEADHSGPYEIPESVIYAGPAGS